MILVAAAKLAAAKGYRQLTIPRIRAAAGVSRRSFDAHFNSVEDCFLAALEWRTAQALEFAARHTRGESWAANVCRTMEALCAYLAGDPVLAALAFEEVDAAGPKAMNYQAETMAVAVGRLHASQPQEQRRSQVATEASVGSIWGLLRHCITSGRAQRLPEIAPTLSYLTLAPALGASSAIEAIKPQAAN